jgi:hypothetical protein
MSTGGGAGRRYRDRYMTAALVVVGVVAVLALLSLAWVVRRTTIRVREAEVRADQMTGRLAEAVDLLEESEAQKRAADRRAGSADDRIRSADQKATDAERRAGDAEKRIAEVQRRAEDARRAAADYDPARTVWELERIRVEREWLDVVGPGIELPVPWDGSMAAVVATELAVIREVMGTPSELALAPGRAPTDPARAAVTARVSVELLRRLARSGEEMLVEVLADRVIVEQAQAPGEDAVDLSGLIAVASSAGMSLSAEPGEGMLKAVLELGPRAAAR